MDDLISRQAAIDALRMDIDIIPFAKAREYARAVIETIHNRLEELPSVQPERKKGVWLDDKDNPESVKTDGYCAYCSACKEWSEYLTAYCGSCGADMRRTWNEA